MEPDSAMNLICKLAEELNKKFMRDLGTLAGAQDSERDV
jgi:hypothetical protein